MRLKYLFALFFILIPIIAIYHLKRNIDEPFFYVQGSFSARQDFVQKLEKYKVIFLSIHIGDQKMPYAAGRIFLNQKLSSSKIPFVLNERNITIIQKGQKLPETFNLKVSLSESEKIMLQDEKKITKVLEGLSLRSRNIDIVF